ncbi:MAG: hypothetical protein FADNKDHG_01501 [Holosporales bacterium]
MIVEGYFLMFQIPKCMFFQILQRILIQHTLTIIQQLLPYPLLHFDEQRRILV